MDLRLLNLFVARTLRDQVCSAPEVEVWKGRTNVGHERQLVRQRRRLAKCHEAIPQ
jgi:hypothetical protein